jgi:hypothetical protein
VTIVASPLSSMFPTRSLTFTTVFGTFRIQ